MLVFLALSIVLITLDFRQGEGGPLETARDIAAGIVAPIQRGFTTVFRPVGDFFASLGDIGDLREDNAEMEEELQGLRQKEAQYDAAIAEVEDLRREADLREHWGTMDSIQAEVSGRVPDNYKWAVTIDKGSQDGIEKDMAVISADGLVGRIVEVDAHESIVLELIDPDAAAAARITQSRDTGTVQGHGPTRPLSLDFIPGEARVNVNDLVVTSGFDDGIFPPGIPIGNVLSITGESSDPEQDITVEPAVDFNALQFVTVLLDSGPNLDEPGKKDDGEERRDKDDKNGKKDETPANAQAGDE